MKKLLNNIVDPFDLNASYDKWWKAAYVGVTFGAFIWAIIVGCVLALVRYS